MRRGRARKTFEAGCMIALCASAVFAQKGNLEQRVAELEKRVAKLEARSAQKAAAAKPASARPAVSVASPAPSYSTYVPLQLKLVTKKLAKASETGEGDQIRFYVQFKNTGSKDITSIDGDLVVKNINAQALLEFGMSAAKYVGTNDSIIWIGAVDYDAKEDGHRAVVDSDKSYLIVELRPTSIQFSDGSANVYRKEEE